mmetsp:Transcript_22178/g.70849  ORF Transcript_22178/g.70849 Transcript_22178/m.70849 type:complete len:250 (-) Transcript_22178:1014-1763(-)
MIVHGHGQCCDDHFILRWSIVMAATMIPSASTWGRGRSMQDGRASRGWGAAAGARGAELADLAQHGLRLLLLRPGVVEQHLAVALGLHQVARVLEVVAGQVAQRLDGVRPSHGVLRLAAREVLGVVVGGLLAVVELLGKERGQAMRRDPLAVVVALGALVALDGLLGAVQLLVASRERAPHARVVRPQGRSLAVIVQGVKVHEQDLIRLSEAVPGAVVAGVDIHGASVRLDGRLCVLELDELVPHERPG